MKQSFKFILPPGLTPIARLSTVSERRQHNTAAPISVLPPEVLCKIFLYYISSFCSPVDHDRSLDLITSICSFWRQTAICAPRLWTRISFIWYCGYLPIPAEDLKKRKFSGIEPPTRFWKVEGTNVARVERHLARSKVLPFTLLIALDRHPDSGGSVLRSLTKTLNLHMK